MSMRNVMPPAGIDAERILSVVAEHTRLRAESINLIASENPMSPAVRRVLSSDLLARYANFSGRDLTNRRYRGNKYIVELEEQCTSLARAAFGAQYVEFRPIGGHIAGVAVIMGLCKPGSIILEIGPEGGGHRLATKLTSSIAASLYDVRFLPFDAAAYNVATAAAINQIEALQPRLVILGSSNFLFPHPIGELADAVHRTGGFLGYDASHVMGLLAAGRFQSPLDEGADVVFGSTHKTLPGPQGGIIFSDRDDVIGPVSTNVYPGLVTNHHPFRIPALALALLEAMQSGGPYYDAVTANSGALAAAIEARGIPMVAAAGRYTASHTVLVRCGGFGDGPAIAARLESANIMTTDTSLPAELGGEGIRLGTQEVTRSGADGQAMKLIADLIVDVILGTRPVAEVRADARDFARSLPGLR
jgi:glycine hydroxymethyltransferase